MQRGAIHCRRSIALALFVLAAPALAAPRAPTVEESPSERRAVRGVALDEASLAESLELRELRRFETEAFPRGTLPSSAADVTPPPLDAKDPSVDARWGGSGDLPLELRSPPTPRSPERATAAPDSEWLRGLVLPELPVRWEPQVIRFLEFFKTDPRGRVIMTSWIRRLGRYRAMFEETFERHGLPKDLIYLAMIESGFEPGAVSRVGAGGVWQFMPGVARAYGLEVSLWLDARRDPERAADAAARYLKDLYVRFGSWHLAFAGYHAGYGGVLKSITRYNTNDYWELCRHEAGLPWETTLYVPKILAAAIIGHNLAAFGYADVAQDPPLAYERVQAQPATTLGAIARATGTRPEVIALLNPELIRERTPPDRGPVSVRLPAGTAALYAEGIEAARGAPDRIETVVLKFGQSLDEVAKARGISLKELKKLNGVRDTSELRPGATVVVPVRAAAAAVTKPAADDDDDTVLVAVPERAFNDENRERVFYRTRDGDTLEEIATALQVRVDELVEWNNLDPDAKLHPKLVLQVFVRKDFDAAGVALLDTAKVRAVTLGSDEFLALEAARRGKTRLQYVARPGDTLAKIARRYGLQPGDLARINRLSYSSQLTEGQNVVVYSPTPELPREIALGRNLPHRRPSGAVSGADKSSRQVATKEATAASTKGAALAKGPGVKGAGKNDAKAVVSAPARNAKAAAPKRADKPAVAAKSSK